MASLQYGSRLKMLLYNSYIYIHIFHTAIPYNELNSFPRNICMRIWVFHITTLIHFHATFVCVSGCTYMSRYAPSMSQRQWNTKKDKSPDRNSWGYYSTTPISKKHFVSAWATNHPSSGLNTLRPRQMDAIWQTTFSNAFSWMKMFEFLLNFHWVLFKFVPTGQINNIPALVQIMAWRRPGDKPLSEPMMVSLPTHICVTRPQWVNASNGLSVHHDYWYTQSRPP